MSATEECAKEFSTLILSKLRKERTGLTRTISDGAVLEDMDGMDHASHLGLLENLRNGDGSEESSELLECMSSAVSVGGCQDPERFCENDSEGVKLTNWRVLLGIILTSGVQKLTKYQYQVFRYISQTGE